MYIGPYVAMPQDIMRMMNAKQQRCESVWLLASGNQLRLTHTKMCSLSPANMGKHTS